VAVKKIEPEGKMKDPAPTKAAAPKLALPTSPNVPSVNLSDYIILLYGEKKIGKTTLANEFDKPIFLSCEEGTRALEAYSVQPKDWKEVLGYLSLLEEGDHDFKTVVIDTVDKFADMCFDYTCTRLCIEHPGDENDFGKSWGIVRKDVHKAISGLTRLGMGLIFISHSKEIEIKSRTGRKYNKIVTTMSGTARQILEAEADVWAYYCYGKQGRRELWISGDDKVSAGNRLNRHFKTVDGKAVQRIFMGDNESEAYAALIDAFNNKQRTQNIEIIPTDDNATTKES